MGVPDRQIRSLEASFLTETGRDGVGVLDVLGFIQNDGGEFVFLQFFKVAAQQGVGGQNDVRVLDLFEHAFAARTVDGQQPERGDEFFRLSFPVGQDRRGHDNERGADVALVLHELDKRKGLDGFSQAHFIGQDAAEPVFLQEVQKTHALQLVGPQGGVEALGLGDLRDLREIVNVRTQFVPKGVGGDFGQVFQNFVENRGFVLFEFFARRFFRVKAQGAQFVAEFFEPAFRQAGVGSVFELHVAFFLGPGLPDFFDGHPLVVVLHGQVEVEPLVVFLAFELGDDIGLGKADLVAGEIFFTVDSVGFHQLGVGVQKKSDRLLRFEKPDGVTARLEIHVLELLRQLRFFGLGAADQKGLAVMLVAAGLQVRVGAGKAVFPVFGLVDVFNLQGEQAAFFIQEKLGVVLCLGEDGLHVLQKGFLVHQVRSRQLGPDPVQKFRDLLLADERWRFDQFLDQFGGKSGLDGIKAFIPTDPERKLAVKKRFMLQDREGGFPFPPEHHIKGQTIGIQLRLEHQAHCFGFNTARMFGILPE